MRRLRFLLPFLAPVLLGAPAEAADEVHLNGGTVLRGQVLRPPTPDADASPQPVRLLLPGGDVVELAASDVKEIREAKDDPQPGKHLRHVNPKAGAPGGLDVAITYYQHPDGGPRVDLIGAVHIGEARYYEQAQRLLDRASVVLYEGVKPKDATAADLNKPQTEEENPVRALQGKFAKWFGLVFQLDSIDYTRKHFVHADMTMEEFAGTPDVSHRAPEEGEAGGAFKGPGRAGPLKSQVEQAMRYVKLIGPLLDRALGGETAGPLRRIAKAVFARMLGSVDMQSAMAGFAPEMADLLLTKRNAVVIERLEEQREKPDVKTVAVFYGAAHMSGIEDELKRMGYRRIGAEWLRAWDLE